MTTETFNNSSRILLGKGNDFRYYIYNQYTNKMGEYYRPNNLENNFEERRNGLALRVKFVFFAAADFFRKGLTDKNVS